MILPVPFSAKDADGFKEHLIRTDYYHLINQGSYHQDCTSKIMDASSADEIVQTFLNSDFAFVTKSRVTLWCHFHCSLRIDKCNRTAYLTELLHAFNRQDDIITSAHYGLIVYNHFHPGVIDSIYLPLEIQDAHLYGGQEYVLHSSADTGCTVMSFGK